MENAPEPSPHSLNLPNLLRITLVVLILAAGTWIRLQDLTADPLDVSHSEQLFFLLTARSYQAESSRLSPVLPGSNDYAAASSDLPLLQPLDAFLADGLKMDLLASARLASIFAWMLAGFFIYRFLRRVTNPLVALAALAMMVFMPFSIQFSRVVLPGAWSLVFAVLALGFLWRWMSAPRWRLAAMSGLCGAAAILLDGHWLYPLLGALVAVSWVTHQKSKGAGGQTWLIFVLFLFPRLIYAISVHPSTLLATWLSFSLPKPDFSTIKQLVRLELRMETMIGVLGIGFALLSVLLFDKGQRRSLLIGLWVGFGVMCLFSLSNIADSFYPLYPLVPLAVISFIPLFELLLERIAANRAGAVNLVFLLFVLVVAAGLGMLDGRRIVKANPEQIPVEYWRGLGQKLGTDAVFLSNSNRVTLPLAYYGRVQPACISANSDCTKEVGSVAGELESTPLYFVVFKSDLEKVLGESDRLAASEEQCDVGSGVVLIPLNSSSPACPFASG